MPVITDLTRYLRCSLLHSFLNAPCFDDTETVKLGGEPEEPKYGAGRDARSGRIWSQSSAGSLCNVAGSFPEYLWHPSACV